jgi:hypothetical protein
MNLPQPLRGLVPRSPDPAKHRIQIVLGLVEERAGAKPVLRQLGFRSNAEYFYPASTVKLFGAVAALERLAALRRETAASGLDLGVDTALVYHPLFAGETLADRDPTNVETGAITLRHEIRKLFLVSDNEAFNRLYEFTGQDGLAATLAAAGLGDAWIVRRLAEWRSPEENRRAPRIEFVVPFEGESYRHEIPERTAPERQPPGAMPGLRVGRAHYPPGDGQPLTEEPLDFSTNNRVSLIDLQRGLCMVVRPDVDCGGSGFALSATDRALLLEAMSQFPRESRNPIYDPTVHPDESTKLLLSGIRRVVPAERIRIFNKYGQAYGFSTENAWIVDTATGAGFFLAATIYTNEDGILNDDEYEYETVAKPFFARLGERAARWFWSTGTVQPKKK